MAEGGSAAAAEQYPALRRLLGTMTGSWRAANEDAVGFLVAGARVRAGGDRAHVETLVGELDDLLAASTSEFQYIQVVIESGAHFSPYGEFPSAEAFVRTLRDRLAAPPAAGTPSPPKARAPVPEPEAVDFPLLRRLLRSLWSGWRDHSDDVDVVDHLGLETRDLVELEGIEPASLLAEIDRLLSSGWSRSEHDQFLSDAGAYYSRAGTVEQFWRDLREQVADLGSGLPRPTVDPVAVTTETLDALSHGAFGRAMTGLVRRYATPALRTGEFAGFRAGFADRLDQVLPQWVERYIDRACHVAQCVVDDATWTRARWMRSAIELLVTEFAGSDAAAFVDPHQVEVIDGLLTSPVTRFARAAGSAEPELPDSHWWWVQESPGAVGHVGLPTHLRWYRGWGTWQARVDLREDDGSADLSARMVRAGLVGLAGAFAPRDATVAVQVRGDDGGTRWAGRSLSARVLGDRLVVDDARLAAAPDGERVITSATIRGTVGGVDACWSVDLVGPVGEASWGWAVLVVDRAPASDGDGMLAEALRGWEYELGAPLVDWCSAATPTLIGRYGWEGETFAHDPPRPHPLLTGISRHLWDGDLQLGLTGVARVYADELFDHIDGRPWEDDWVAALRYVGADGWAEFVGRLVHWTRELSAREWYVLCATRSGIQFVDEELGDERLAGLVDAQRVRTLDVAMRAFGHLFGPIPLPAVPGRLHRIHRWWRYPAGTPNGSEPADLRQLVVGLRSELDRSDRPTGAETSTLTSILRGCERVLDGTLVGFGARDAETVCGLVVEGWSADAELSHQVLGYFRPITYHESRWALPKGRS